MALQDLETNKRVLHCNIRLKMTHLKYLISFFVERIQRQV